MRAEEQGFLDESVSARHRPALVPADPTTRSKKTPDRVVTVRHHWLEITNGSELGILRCDSSRLKSGPILALYA
jgi:hypothetical protein